MSDYQDKKNSSDGFYWLIALGLLCTGFGSWIGVLMIVLKLLDGDGKKKKKRQQGRHPYYQQQYGQESVGARTTCEAPSWEEPPQAAPAWKASAAQLSDQALPHASLMFSYSLTLP